LTLSATIQRITDVDRSAMTEAQRHWQQLTLHSGSLGVLEEMVCRYIGITRSLQPALPRKCMVLASADHGVAQQGISAYPVETTIHMTRNYLIAKGSGANALANHCSADIVVVDMGVNGDLSDVPGLWHRKIAYGTQDMTLGPAMSHRQAVQSLATGIEIVSAKVKEGYRCFSLGEMGIGNTLSSAAIVAAFGRLSPAEATGRGTGICDERLRFKISLVQQALTVNQPDPRDGVDVLAKVGGFELGCLAGVILGAAAHQCLVVLDGFNAGAAALIAQSLAPLSREYLLSSHLSAEPGHRKTLELLGLQPYINMGLRLGEASGASLGMTLLDAGLRCYLSIAAFTDLQQNGSLGYAEAGGLSR